MHTERDTLPQENGVPNRTSAVERNPHREMRFSAQATQHKATGRPHLGHTGSGLGQLSLELTNKSLQGEQVARKWVGGEGEGIRGIEDSHRLHLLLCSAQGM